MPQSGYFEYRLRYQLICLIKYIFFYFVFLLFYVFSHFQFSHNNLVMLRTSRSYCWYEGMNCDNEHRLSLAVNLWEFDGFLHLLIYVMKDVHWVHTGHYDLSQIVSDIGVFYKIILMPLLAPWYDDMLWVCLWLSSEF